MTKAELRKEWEARVVAFKDSGQSTSAWCAAHDLQPHQLRYWLRENISLKKGKFHSLWKLLHHEDGGFSNLLVSEFIKVI